MCQCDISFPFVHSILYNINISLGFQDFSAPAHGFSHIAGEGGRTKFAQVPHHLVQGEESQERVDCVNFHEGNMGEKVQPMGPTLA